MEKNTSFNAGLVEQAEKSFGNIKKAISGLFKVLQINLEEEDIYFQAGCDNLKALYRNFLELMLNEHGTRYLMNKLRKAELEVDITLDESVKMTR